MKLVVSDQKTGKSFQMEINKDLENYFIGKSIGQTLDGNLIGLPGYKLKITGGSDFSGFPMRPDLAGTQRKKVLLSSPPGYRPKEKGIRKRKSVVGKVISSSIEQINSVVLEYGPKPLEELMPKSQKEEKK
jgi:small subunit ribosomal protein S6e